MSESGVNPYQAPEGVDVNLSAMQERLIELQPALKSLMGKALGLFADLYPQAPSPLSAKDPMVVYATKSLNVCPETGLPMARELTVVLGAARWVRVFRNTDSSPNSYPRERLWLWRPQGEGLRNVNVLKTHDPSRVDFPYDIETADYDNKKNCLGFVGGAAYYGQEPFIAEADEALDEARQLAQNHGYARND